MSYILAETSELAFVALLSPAIKTALALPNNAVVPCFPGKTQSERPAPPSVTCAVLDVGPEDPKDTGNFWVVMEIEIVCEAQQQPGQKSNTVDISKSLVSAVALMIYDTDLETNLSNAVPNFTVFPNSMMRPGQPKREYTEEGYWVDNFHLRFLACATTFPTAPPIDVDLGVLVPTTDSSGNIYWQGTDMGTGQPAYVYIQNNQIKVSNQPPP